jgi:hypothetical protein
MERKTRLKLALMVFVFATFFLLTGLWKTTPAPVVVEEGKTVITQQPAPLLSQDNWVLLSLSILGIYTAGKTVTHVQDIRINGKPE